MVVAGQLDREGFDEERVDGDTSRENQ